MANRNEFEDLASGILKAELKRKGITYAQLAEKLQEIGVDEKEANIRNKLARGKFSAAFFLATMMAIGQHEIRI